MNSEIHVDFVGQRNRLPERGGSKLKALLALGVLVALVFTAYKLVPVYFANYQFQDAIDTESKFALTGYPQRTENDIRQDVVKKARDLGIPAKPEDIQLVIDRGRVDISLDYSVPIDLILYQFTLQFHPHADNHSI